MNLEVIRNSSFLTALYQNGQSPVQALEGKIAHAKRKAFAYDLLSKITMVAMVGIMGAVLFASFTALAVSSGIMVSMTFSTAVMGWGITQLAIQSAQFLKAAEQQSQILFKLREIEHWKTPEITQFILEHQLTLEQIPLQGLKKLKEEEPLLPLLPLIALVECLKSKSSDLAKLAKEGVSQLEAGFSKQEADTGQRIDREIKQTLSFEAVNSAWRQYEQGAVPLALHAAAILELIQNPTKDFDLHPFSLEIPGVGTCKARTFAERVWGGLNPHRKNDDYFFFNQAGREPLTLSEIEKCNLDPGRLHLLLFPKEMRV